MSRINSKLFLVTQIIIQYVDARVTRVAMNLLRDCKCKFITEFHCSKHVHVYIILCLIL